jgi:hypothetical protein
VLKKYYELTFAYDGENPFNYEVNFSDILKSIKKVRDQQ